MVGEPRPFIPATKMVPHELEAVPGYRRLASLGGFHSHGGTQQLHGSFENPKPKLTMTGENSSTSVLGNLHMNPVPLCFFELDTLDSYTYMGSIYIYYRL